MTYLREKQHFSRRMAYTVKQTRMSRRRTLPAARLSSVAMETGSVTQRRDSGGTCHTDRAKQSLGAPEKNHERG
jgi:hypothetical protein